jgi:hypothetical protein
MIALIISCIACFFLGAAAMYGLIVLIVKYETKTDRYKKIVNGNDQRNAGTVAGSQRN